MNLTDRLRLDGKAAIVTAASRGIGAASAVALAEQGADVVISARDADSLAEVAERIGQHSRAEVVPADLSDLDNMATLVERCAEAFGRVDVVVNNLGGTGPRPFMDTSVGYVERALRFNAVSAFALTKAAAPVMLDGDGGSVVNITSAIARFRERGFLAYSTAKSALAHLTRQMSIDLAPRIRVNAVAPGAIATDALGMVVDDESLTQTVIEHTPMRRLGEVEDIAFAVVYLASEAASYLTGKTIEVDGGIEAANLPLGLPDL